MRTSTFMPAAIWLALGAIACAQTAPPADTPPAEPKAETPATEPRAETPAAPVPVSEVVAAIPPNAKLALVVRDLSELDAKLTELSQRAAFMPISGLTLAKGWLEMVAGVKDEAPLAVILVPSEPGEALFNLPVPVLLVPTTDREALLRLLQPEPVLQDYVRIKLRGAEGYANTKGKFTVIGPTLATVKSVVTAPRGTPAQLTPYQRARLEANDVTLWMDLPWLMTQGGEGSLRRPLTDRFGTDFVEQTKSVHAGVRVQPEGLAIELCVAPSTASPTAASKAASPNSLLTGLPAEQYVCALGMTSAAATPFSQAVIDRVLETLGGFDQQAPERVAQFRQTLASLSSLSQRGAVSVALLPEGPYGRIGLTKVVETSCTSESMLEEFAAFVRQLPEAPLADPRLKALLSRVSYERGAEQAGDISIDHFRLDLTDLGSVDPETVATLLGTEGVLFRVAPAGDHRIVVALGGGRARFDAVLAAARSGQAPLAADVGVVRAASHLPEARQVEGYFSVDQALQLGKLLDQVTKPVEPVTPDLTLPEVHAPVSFAARPIEQAGWQVDVFVPVELLSAIRQAVMESLAREVKLTP